MISEFTNIVTRLIKGSELTWSEMDTNLTRLKDEIIDQSIRNDSIFDKSITFENNNIGSEINVLLIKIPIKNSDNPNFVEGTFVFEGLINFQPDGSSRVTPIYFKNLFYDMEYPGLTNMNMIDQLNTGYLNSNAGLFSNYEYNYSVAGYHQFKFQIDEYDHFKNYKFTIKLPDNDFNNGIYDLANATIEEIVYVDPNSGV